MKDPVVQIYEGLTEAGLAEARGHRTPSQRFRASESGKCSRQIAYRLSGSRPAPPTARLKMYGVCGDNDHDLTRAIMEQHGCELGGVKWDDEKAAYEELINIRKEFTRVSGAFEVTFTVACRADGEVVTPRGPSILEIKGTGHWPYDWLNKAYTEGYKTIGNEKMPPGHDAALQRIKEKHSEWYAQCQTSMGLTGHTLCYLLVKDRGTGTLGLYNEETGERTGIYIEFDPEFWEGLLDKFALIQTRLNQEKLPVPGYPAGSKECSYCDHRYRCHDAMEREQRGKSPAIVYPGPNMDTEVEDADSST